MPPKSIAVDARQCNLCDNPIHTGLRPAVVRHSSARLTVFRCTKCRGPLGGAWHAECVTHQFDPNDTELYIQCSVCNNYVTARREPRWWVTLFWFAWASYPALPWWISPVGLQFAINRILDVVAMIVGFVTIAMLNAAVPHVDDYKPGVGKHVVEHELPLQFARLHTQATNEHNPTLAIATFAAAWITGWNVISIAINTIWLALALCRWKRRQISRGVTIQ